MNKWKWFVYIVECRDNTFYTGMTWSVDIRSEQHASGLGSKYTAKHGFKCLKYFEIYDDIYTAREREKQIKGWSQAKKKKLISGEWRFA